MVEDTTITEVHFCNKTTPNSLVVETYIEDGELFANIPNILLQDNWDICVYAYCDCYTKVEERVKVKARSKPSDYVYTETEVKEWDDLVQRLDEIEKKGVSDEVVANAVEQYLIDNPIGATDEQVAQINKNTEDIEALNSGKLDKVEHTKAGVYAVLPNNDTPFLHDYSENAKANTLAKRWANGTLSVGTPTADEHATTKKYVDTAIANIKIPEGEDVDLSDYYTKTEIDNKGYLTEHQDISGKADRVHTHKMSDITDYVAPSFEGYATEKYVDDAIAEVSVGDLSIVLTDDGEGNVSFVGSTLTDGEEVQY